MLTPEGQSATKIDKIMLLAMWAKYIETEIAKNPGTKTNLIKAGMGRPTYPLNPNTHQFLADYWKKHSGNAIDYGQPQGDIEARDMMASAMSKWYRTEITASNILFTVGGVGALKAIFSALKVYFKDTTNFRVLTPFPYYSIYADNQLNLQPIEVMQNPGYRLTADSLRESILAANKLAAIDGGFPRAVLICDPNNPLGTVLEREELLKIAEVLRANPDLLVILDEAYAEMVFGREQHTSLITLAPDLKERIIVLRSATKGLNAAGERMAITIAFNQELMALTLREHIHISGHAPRSLQMAYAYTMAKFEDRYRIDGSNFYESKVKLVYQRLVSIGALLPDSSFKSQGTFYALADLSDLIGGELPVASDQALNKPGQISSDEDIAYSLLFEDNVMIAPLSYFGVTAANGYMRITCSGDEQELNTLMDRLESRLLRARTKIQEKLNASLDEILQKLVVLDKAKYNVILSERLAIAGADNTSAKEKKETNDKLKKLYSNAHVSLLQASTEGQHTAALKIQSHFRGHRTRDALHRWSRELDKEWHSFINNVTTRPGNMRDFLKSITSAAERAEYQPWLSHIRNQGLLFNFFKYTKAVAPSEDKNPSPAKN